MAIYWGATSGGFRLGIDITGSGTTRTIIVYGQSVGYGHNWTNTLELGGSLSGTQSVSFYSPTGGTVTKEFYRTTQTWNGARTFTASITYWNGSASVSRSVVNGSPAGLPSNLTMTRKDAQSATYSWTKGSNTTTTRIQLNTNGSEYTWATTTTGSSHTITGMGSNNSRTVRIRGESAGGNSGWVYGPTFYGKPNTPSKPTLGSDQKVTWSNTARYVSGVDLQRTDNGGSTVTDYALGKVSTWIDPNAQEITTQYRVRTWAGTGEGKAESNWSAWSESALDVIYQTPRVSRFQVDRCNSAGQLDPLGTYLRVVSSGEVFSVKETGGPELNHMTRRVSWRGVGDPAWGSPTVLVNEATPGAWTSLGVTVGGGTIAVTDAYEVRLEVIDAYSQVVQQVTVPAAQTALSIGRDGIGAGKVIERGALDVAGDFYLEGDSYLVVDGQAYEMSGSTTEFTLAAMTQSATGTDVWRTTGTVTPPFTPPTGWGFNYYALTTSGFTAVSRTNDTTIRVIQVGASSTSALKRLGWQLVKI